MAQPRLLSAKSLYQKHIDIVTDLFWRRDWDALLMHLQVPGVWETPDAAPERIKSHAALRDRITQKRAALEDMGVTDYHRICETAEFANAARTQIRGRHRTFVMRSGAVLLDPYLCDMPLVLTDGIWKSSGYRTSLRNGDPRAAPRPLASGTMPPGAQSPDARRDQDVTKA